MVPEDIENMAPGTKFHLWNDDSKTEYRKNLSVVSRFSKFEKSSLRFGTYHSCQNPVVILSYRPDDLWSHIKSHTDDHQSNASSDWCANKNGGTTLLIWHSKASRGWLRQRSRHVYLNILSRYWPRYSFEIFHRSTKAIVDYLEVYDATPARASVSSTPLIVLISDGFKASTFVTSGNQGTAWYPRSAHEHSYGLCGSNKASFGINSKWSDQMKLESPLGREDEQMRDGNKVLYFLARTMSL